LEIYGKISIVLFKTFFDANTAREFLLNGSNFKDSERFNFQVRWFKSEDELLTSDTLKSKMSRYSTRLMEMQNKGMNSNLNNNLFGFYNNNWNMNNEPNMTTTSFNMNQNINEMCINMSNVQMGAKNLHIPMHMQNMPNFQKLQNVNIPLNKINHTNSSFNSFSKKTPMNNYIEEKKTQIQHGKFTCRFEIQIENDKEFQVARKLIGAKVSFINIGL
jgi:hypothetical protein